MRTEGMETAVSQAPYLTNLPDALLLQIFDKVHWRSRLTRLVLCCKRFRLLGNAIKFLALNMPFDRSFYAWYSKWGGEVRSITFEGQNWGLGGEFNRIGTLSWHVHLTDLLVTIALAPNVSRIEELCIKFEDGVSTSALVPLRHFPGLKSLFLEDIHLEAPLTSAFADLQYITSLERLELRSCENDSDLEDSVNHESLECASIFWDSISKLSKLEILTLSGIPGLPLLEAENRPALTQLRELNIDQEHVNFPTDLSFLAGLERLVLVPRSRPTGHPARLSQLLNLQDLVINLNKTDGIADDYLYSLPVSSLSPYLQSLSICNANLSMRLTSEDFVWARFFEPACYSLRELCLSSLNLTSVPEAIIQLSNLHLLGLASNQLKLLPAGPYLFKLRVLDLGQNEQLRFPYAVAQCADLRLLFLDGCARMNCTHIEAGVLGRLANLAKVFVPPAEHARLAEATFGLYGVHSTVLYAATPSTNSWAEYMRHRTNVNLENGHLARLSIMRQLPNCIKCYLDD